MLRTFCIGRKGWVLINFVKGAKASAVIYSLTENAKLNKPNPYSYLEYVLTKMLEVMATIKSNEAIRDTGLMESLMPWLPELPPICKSKHR